MSLPPSIPNQAAAVQSFVAKHFSELCPETITVDANYDPKIRGMSLDSRSIQPDYLFVAKIGAQSDGRNFIDEAIAKGAIAVLSEVENNLSSNFYLHKSGCPVYTHENIADILGDIAAKFYATNEQNVRLIGITGTNGKTSSCHYLAQALTQAGFKVAVLGTNGNGFLSNLEKSNMTTLDVISCHEKITHFAQEGAEFVCMEVSSHSLDQQRVAGLNFDCAMFTNLSQDHLDYHGDMSSYLSSKEQLFHLPRLKHSIINAAGPGASIIKNLSTEQSFDSIGDSAATLYSLHAEQTVVGLQVCFTYQENQFEILNPYLMGSFNGENLALCFLSLCYFGIAPKVSCQLLEQVKPALGRMQKVAPSFASDTSLDKPFQLPDVYIDFAHTPDALEKALQAINALGKERVIVVFGCGGNKDKTKRPLMGGIAESLSDVAIVTSDNPRSEPQRIITENILAGVKHTSDDNIIVEENRSLAIQQAIHLASANDVVLIAGKGHESTQELAEQTITFNDFDISLAALNKRSHHGEVQ